MKSIRDYINLVEGTQTRYATPAEYDAEIARFSKGNNIALAPNKRYIDTLNAEKASLGKQPATTAPAQTAPATTAPAQQGATPAASRYKTPAEYDAEIARFSKGNNIALAPNKRYIDALNAEKASLGKQQGSMPTQKQPAPTAAARPDPNVKALQDKLIAAGAKIKADGIMGPLTRAAQQQFPQVTTQSPEEQAVAADLLSANDGSPDVSGAAAQVRNPTTGQAATPAQAASTTTDRPSASTLVGNTAPASNNPWAPKPDTTKQDAWAKLSPEQQKWLGGADPTDPFILARMRSAVPDAPAQAATPATPQAPVSGQAATPANPNEKRTPQEIQASKDLGGAMEEGITFRNDELTRIISLVQHR